MNKEKIKIYDNFLSQKDFKNIQETMQFSSEFPWFYNETIDHAREKTKNFQFTHVFYSNFQVNSDFFPLVVPIINKIEPLSIIRIKANLNPRSDTKDAFNFHRDIEDKRVKTAIYYVNTHNGPTIFKNNEKVDAVENRFVIFDSDELHAATNTTDSKSRIIINFNFIK